MGLIGRGTAWEIHERDGETVHTRFVLPILIIARSEPQPEE